MNMTSSGLQCEVAYWPAMTIAPVSVLVPVVSVSGTGLLIAVSSRRVEYREYVMVQNNLSQYTSSVTGI